MRKPKIPANFPVRPLADGATAKDRATCATCGLSWDDGIATSYTPTPAARCPFESFHVAPKPRRKRAAVILCAEWGPPLFNFRATVMLVQHAPDSFAVRYGRQLKSGLNYAQAAAEFGACVMHAAACNGNLDNRTRAEARADGDTSVNAQSIRGA